MTVREVHRAHAAGTASPGCRCVEGKRVVGIVTNRDLRFEDEPRPAGDERS